MRYYLYIQNNLLNATELPDLLPPLMMVRYHEEETTMKIKDPNKLEIFQSIINEYNSCFYKRDIDRLKNLYVPDGDIIYFDNHADCDSTDLEDRIKKVGNFFSNGNIEELTSEDFVVYKHGQCACMLIKFRYPSHPTPCVRTTYYLELHDDQWKIRHIHCSFDPNE